jgi:peptide/nickel transport system permease protein
LIQAFRRVVSTLVLHQLTRAASVLLGVSLLAFASLDLAPGDPLAQMRLDPHVTPAAMAALRERYGLDRPFVERYTRWLGAVARGDLGYSIAYDSPIAPLLARRAVHSLLLVGTALVATWMLALPLGVWTAARSQTVDGRLLAGITTALQAVPDLLIAVALLLFAAASGAFPTGGLRATGLRDARGIVALRDQLHHLVLPVLALALGAAPALVRHVRASMMEVLRAPYLLAAAARGVPSRRLLFRSALRAAANPLISLFGLSFAALFSASMLVEVIMSWPGLGPLFLDAVRSRDVQLVLAGVLCSTALLIVGNGCADILLRAADPRIAR